jgi:hypothetical protein
MLSQTPLGWWSATRLLRTANSPTS